MVVGSTNISVKAVSQFVHPTFNQFSRMKRKITIPSMSMRLLPLKNRLLTRSRVSTVSNCVITKNSTETTMDRREKEERERERKKRKSESFALPFMVQTCNGSYSHTGIPHVQNEGPDGCNGPGNGEAVGEILLSEHEEDDRSGFGSHIDVPPEDPFRPRTENTMWKGREDADGDGEIEGNIEEREACTLISDIDADSYKCGVANPPLDMRASSLSATSRRRVSSTISEPFATSGSVFEGYTERKMTFLLVDGMYMLMLYIILNYLMYSHVLMLYFSSLFLDRISLLPDICDSFINYS